MKVGDLVRVKNIRLDSSKVVPGFLMQILEIKESHGYYVVVLQGGSKYLGLKHWISGIDLEVIG